MKKLRLPCAYHTLDRKRESSQEPVTDGMVFGDAADGDGQLSVKSSHLMHKTLNFINREQAEALIAHLTAVFGLATPQTTPVNPYVIHED